MPMSGQRSSSRRAALVTGAAVLALCLALFACATAQEVLPCWVAVRVDHRLEPTEEPLSPALLDDARRLVDARLEGYGVEQRTVVGQASDQLVVGLPERWATDDVFSLVVAPGSVTFVPLPAGEGEVQADAPLPEDWPVLLGSADISDVRLGREQGHSTLEFQFTQRGARLLDTWSRANLGRQLLIAIDGSVAFAPIVQGPLGQGGMRLTGADEQRMRWLAAILAFGPLPAEVVRTGIEQVPPRACPTT